MSETRPGWVSSEPRGRRCAPGWRARAQPAPAALLRPVPTTRWYVPSAGACMTRHHRGFTCIHPSGLPQPVTLGWNKGPWALSSGFAPRGYPRRTPRWGQALHTGLGPPLDSSRVSLVASTPLKRPHVATAQCNSPQGFTDLHSYLAARARQQASPAQDRRPQAPQQHRPAPCRTRRRCLADPGLGGPDAGGLGAGAAA